jgi:hypothetical protein
VINDLPVNLLVDAIDLAGRRLIHRIEQGGERLAQAEAPATAVTNIEYARQLLLEGGLVVKVRIAPVDGVARRRF